MKRRFGIPDGAPIAWGYCRVSTKKQEAHGFSLEDQQRLVRVKAQTDGQIIGDGRLFLDRGESAYEGDCPEMRRLLDAIKASRRPALVYVTSLDRLARHIGYQQALLTEMAALGARLIVLTQPALDLATADGKFNANIMGAVNQNFSDRLSERMKLAMAGSRERGRWGHQWPVGYVRDAEHPGIGRIHDEQGPLMREAFRRVAEGEPVARVHRGLQKRGLRASRTRFCELLRHPIYAGLNVLADGREVPGLWQAITKRETWDAVQRRLQHRGNEPRAYVKDSDIFPLKGTVKGGCGCALTGDSAVRGKIRMRRDYYDCRCRGEDRKAGEHIRVTPAVLHAEFENLLRRIVVTEPFTKEQIIAAWKEKQADVEKDRQLAERQLVKVEDEQQQAADAFTRAPASLQALLARRADDLEQKHAAIASRIAELNDVLCTSEVEIDALASFVAAKFEDVAATWAASPLEVKQALQKFIFPAGLTVTTRADGSPKIRTPITSPVFRVFPRLAGGDTSGWRPQQDKVRTLAYTRTPPRANVIAILPKLREIAEKMGFRAPLASPRLARRAQGQRSASGRGVR